MESATTIIKTVGVVTPESTESTGTWQDKLLPAQNNKIKWAHRYVSAYKGKHVGRSREHEQLVLVHDLAELLDQMQRDQDTLIERLAASA